MTEETIPEYFDQAVSGLSKSLGWLENNPGERNAVAVERHLDAIRDRVDLILDSRKRRPLKPSSLVATEILTALRACAEDVYELDQSPDNRQRESLFARVRRRLTAICERGFDITYVCEANDWWNTPPDWEHLPPQPVTTKISDR
ncbi:MAG: hypothetical protein NXI04_15915 [Planctomycetaceae bacterium]|nr:hypothetical protein [Planctomycetaceae bacterium]